MEKEYVSLHTHSEYSLIDGKCKLPELAKQAAAFGMPALAITDHGSMGGCVRHYQACEKAGIKPILGMEAYIAEYAKKEEARSKGVDPKINNHIVLLAKNNEGYLNLKKLASASYDAERFYKRPRIDFQMLSEHKEGLIVSSACLKGEIADALVKFGPEGYHIACRIASKYKELFGDDFYLELMFHCFDRNGHVAHGNQKVFKDQQQMVFDQTVKIGRELGIKTIWTNDCHYITADDFVGHQIKKATQFHRLDSDGEELEARKLDYNEFYLKCPEQVYEEFKGYEEAIEQTLEVAAKCNVELPIGPRKKTRLPMFDIPEDPVFIDFKSAHKDAIWYLNENAQYLTYLSWKGMAEKGFLKDPEYVDRLKYELAVINKTEFAKYLLIVRDYVQKSWELNDYTGPGRGCFLPECKVRTLTGIMKPICDVQVGDEVLSHDGTFHKVQNTYQYEVDEEMVEVEFDDCRVIKCTLDHEILTRNSGWTQAQYLSEGDEVVDYSTSLSHRSYQKVKSKSIFKYKGTVHDLRVAETHSYNIESLIVHNSAAGSLVLFLIGITYVDPIKHDLSFERFLAAEKGYVLEWRDLL